jgi:hypothetical protein
MGNDCDSLEIGSFYFLSVNAWPVAVTDEGEYVKNPGRHGDVAIFPFQDIPGNLDLYLTDRAWDEWTKLFVPNNVTGEGIVMFQTPNRGIGAGIVFGTGNNTLVEEFGSSWTDVDVNGEGTTTSQYFELGEDGDQAFLYCVGSDGNDRPIAAFSNNGPFLRNMNPGTNTYATSTSSAPDYFFEEPGVNSSITTTSTPGLLVMRTPSAWGEKVFWNWEYQSPCGPDCIMDLNDLRNAMSDADANWIGNYNRSLLHPMGFFLVAMYHIVLLIELPTPPSVENTSDGTAMACSTASV